MHRKLVLMLIPLLFISCFAFSRLSFGAVKNLNVGIIGPVGLPHWSPGGMWDGARLARDEINAAGGISIGSDTYMINLLQEDEHSYPTIDYIAAAGALTNLIGSGAKLVIGGFRTEVVAPGLLPVIRSAKVPFFIDGAATAWLVNLSTPALYTSDKYIFRVNPVNDTVLLPVICSYIRDYLLPQKLNKTFGQDLDGNPATALQTRIGVLTEQLSWANSIHYALTTLYSMPYLPGPTPNPYYLGPCANLTFQARIDPYAVVTAKPELDAAQAAGCRLLIIIFSAPFGDTVIKEWYQYQYPFIPVGINVMGQLSTHWYTAPYPEYEVILNFAGTATAVIPGKTEVFWNNFVGNYSAWPIYTAWGAYDTLYAFKETLENINASDIAAVQDYLDGGPTASDVLIPYFEKTDRTALNGKFVYTSGIYGKGTGHDVFSIELGITMPLGYVRAFCVQWINGSKMSAPGGWMTVVSPNDKGFSRKTLIPHWMYPLALWDIDYNGKVDMMDLWYAAKSFGAVPGIPRWDVEADINADGKNDMVDLWEIAKNFGKEQHPWPMP